MQKLSYILFDVCENLIDNDDHVYQAFESLLYVEKGYFESNMDSLTPRQKSLMKALANEKTQSIYSHDYITKHNLESIGGIQQSVDTLSKNYLITKENRTWKVVDPVMEAWLRGHFFCFLRISYLPSPRQIRPHSVSGWKTPIQWGRPPARQTFGSIPWALIYSKARAVPVSSTGKLYWARHEGVVSASGLELRLFLNISSSWKNEYDKKMTARAHFTWLLELRNAKKNTTILPKIITADGRA